LSPLVIEDMADDGAVIRVRARTPDRLAACPGCGAGAGRAHSYHERPRLTAQPPGPIPSASTDEGGEPMKDFNNVSTGIEAVDAMFTGPITAEVPSADESYSYKKKSGSSDTKTTKDVFE
jgi:hypothetical protein